MYRQGVIPKYRQGDINQLHLDYETIINSMKSEKDLLVFQAFSKFSYKQMITAQQRTPKQIIKELATFDSDRDYEPSGVKEIEKSLSDLLSLTRMRQQFIAYKSVSESISSTDNYIEQSLIPQLRNKAFDILLFIQDPTK